MNLIKSSFLKAVGGLSFLAATASILNLVVDWLSLSLSDWLAIALTVYQDFFHGLIIDNFMLVIGHFFPISLPDWGKDILVIYGIGFGAWFNVSDNAAAEAGWVRFEGPPPNRINKYVRALSWPVAFLLSLLFGLTSLIFFTFYKDARPEVEFARLMMRFKIWPFAISLIGILGASVLVLLVNEAYGVL